ncbi:hypothetical protein [Halomonas colorata]|uniref:Antitoxin Xre/MbcA/ParS-like toxin-binding domain-containing protein n=1 Tax=Halomonas colorata TaxID=2742615 RepID=A0ABR9G2W5_9GAMM|nr:hypothetical protein [Halomonas colorata]MBE0465209.1 hypothetical protein [Halomonas colorata]
MLSLSPDGLAILLPLSILLAALLMFGSGLVWARYRDQQNKRQDRETLVQDILIQVEPWAGSRAAAWAWYQTYPIAALGGLTAEQLIARGKVDEVTAYIAHIRQDGYA